MSWKRGTYASIRGKMQPGDIIAFAGKKPVSDAIKLFTNSNVSHVGIVLHSELVGDETAQPNRRVRVAEATAEGVQFSRLSHLEEAYEGELWWLPLSDEARRKLDKQKLIDFLLDQEGKPYDYGQAVKAAIDGILDVLGPTANREDFDKFFCSELVVAALEKAGVLGQINASEVLPIELCQFNLYKEKYVQFKGSDDIKIRGFNSIDLSRWED